MVRVLTGLGFTASHCRAEDGIRVVESIPKANCQTSTRHISCSLILPPPFSSEGRRFSGQSTSFLRADVVCVWHSVTSLLSSHWLGPLSSSGIMGNMKRITSVCFQYAHTVLRNSKRVETAPLFGSQWLQESSTFDWWLQLMSSRAYVIGTWRTDIDPLPLTHLSLCWQNMNDLNTEGRLSQIRYHILAAVVSVSITLCRLLLCNTYSIIKMKQIHSRCCGLLSHSERLMIFPFVFCL